jgi:hypothetical protein
MCLGHDEPVTSSLAPGVRWRCKEAPTSTLEKVGGAASTTRDLVFRTFQPQPSRGYFVGLPGIPNPVGDEFALLRTS